MASIYDLMPQSYDAMSGQWSPAGSTGEEIVPPQSGYDRAVSALHGLASHISPFAMAGLDPQSLDAQRAAQAQQPIGDAASEAWNTATSAVNPLTAAAIGGARLLGHTLAPIPAGSGEPNIAADVATPDETRQLTDLRNQIDKLNGDRSTALKKAPWVTGPDGSRNKDPKSTEGIDAQLKDARDQITGLYQTWGKRRETRLQSEAPFAQTASPGTKDFLANTPAVGGSMGLIGGLIKNKPLTYALSTLFGGIEGAGAAGYPTYRDLQLPEGSPAELAAQQRLHDPNFWLTHVVPEAGYGAVSGLMGSYYGGRLRGGVAAVGNAIKSGIGALRGGTAATEVAAPATAASALTAPTPINTDTAGRAVHVGQNGRTMFQDKLGRWQHVGGGMVKKEHQPLWSQLSNQ